MQKYTILYKRRLYSKVRSLYSKVWLPNSIVWLIYLKVSLLYSKVWPLYSKVWIPCSEVCLCLLCTKCWLRYWKSLDSLCKGLPILWYMLYMLSDYFISTNLRNSVYSVLNFDYHYKMLCFFFQSIFKIVFLSEIERWFALGACYFLISTCTLQSSIDY